MGYLNKVLLIGRLTRDPEKRVTPSGHSVVNVGLATSEKFKDKQGNQQEKTEFHNLVFWNRQAEIVEQYLKKGSQLYVEGSLQTEEWQDKDGNKRQTTKIMARSMQFLDSKPQGQQNQSQQNNQQGGYQQQNNQSYSGPQDQDPSVQPQQNQEDFLEDDIPF